MPSLDLAFLRSLHEDYTKYPCFIETGTLNGSTIFAMEPYFERLYTIEFSEKYYNQTRRKYIGYKIQFIHGDSSVVFGSMLHHITEKCIFFLDGHYSSGDTGRSAKDCPLDEEVTHIHELFPYEAIIVIDDFRLFGLDASSGKLAEDWSKISKDNLLRILESRIRKVYHLDSECGKDDRLIIHIDAKTLHPVPLV
jgi:hypothetical protein